MKTYYKLILSSLFIVLLASSCKNNDTWDEYYFKEVEIAEKGLLVEELTKIPGITKFANAVKTCGIDTIIGKNQLFTVFAFNDEAFDSLPEEVINDTEKLRGVILFHIYLNKMSSIVIQEGLYKTLSGKYSLLEVTNEGTITINAESSVTDVDKLAKNGIVHIIDKPSVPSPNLFDFLADNPLFSKYVDYINNQQKIEFDKNNSEIIGFTDTGNPIYDSVFVATNLFLANYPIDSEDDQFSMLIPSNINDAIETAKEGINFNSEVPDGFFVSPVMKSSLLSGVYKRDELTPDLLTVEGQNLSSDLLGLLSEDDQGTPLSNGRAYVVNGYTIDRDALYAPIILNKNQMWATAHKSPLVNRASGDRIYWIPTNGSQTPESRYGQYVDFIINKDFLPLPYKFIFNMRPYGAGKCKFEVNGVEVENSPFVIESLDPDAQQDVEMGIVNFDKFTNPVTIRITFLEQHKRTDAPWSGLWKKQYLLSHGCRFEPILN